ncbi:hypothetical protein ALFP_2241 [Alcaligenes faecalis]|nr:hypothetical protein ALFP_2241 [Alcaligenes faecalis]
MMKIMSGFFLVRRAVEWPTRSASEAMSKDAQAYKNQ